MHSKFSLPTTLAHNHDEVENQIMTVDPMGLIQYTNDIDTEITKAEHAMQAGHYKEAKALYDEILLDQPILESALQKRPDAIFYIILQRYSVYNNLSMAQIQLRDTNGLATHLAEALFYELFMEYQDFMEISVEKYEENGIRYLTSWQLAQEVFPELKDANPYQFVSYDVFDKILAKNLYEHVDQFLPMSFSFFLPLLTNHLMGMKNVQEFRFGTQNPLIENGLQYIRAHVKEIVDHEDVRKKIAKYLYDCFSLAQSPSTISEALDLMRQQFRAFTGATPSYTPDYIQKHPEEICQILATLSKANRNLRTENRENNESSAQLIIAQSRVGKLQREHAKLEQTLQDMSAQLRSEKTLRIKQQKDIARICEERDRLIAEKKKFNQEKQVLMNQIKNEKNKREKEKRANLKQTNMLQSQINKMKELGKEKDNSIKKLKMKLSEDADRIMKQEEQIWDLKEKIRQRL